MDEARLQLASLQPRTLELVRALCTRGELSIVDCALVIGIAIGNARPRLRVAYRKLGLEGGRTELMAKYGRLFAEEGKK